MINLRKFNPTMRAVGVISAVAILVGGVTFAALQSNSVVLADSEFSTQTASLKIWNGSSYDVNASGFSFNNLPLDTESSQFTFWLKNDGTAPLTVKGLGSLGSYTGFTDFSKVHIHITNITATGTADYTFAQLLDGTPDALPGNPLAPNAEDQYGVTVKIDNDAVTSASSASVTGFDWTFTGTNP